MLPIAVGCLENRRDADSSVRETAAKPADGGIILPEYAVEPQGSVNEDPEAEIKGGNVDASETALEDAGIAATVTAPEGSVLPDSAGSSLDVAAAQVRPFDLVRAPSAGNVSGGFQCYNAPVTMKVTGKSDALTGAVTDMPELTLRDTDPVVLAISPPKSKSTVLPLCHRQPQGDTYRIAFPFHALSTPAAIQYATGTNRVTLSYPAGTFRAAGGGGARVTVNVHRGKGINLPHDNEPRACQELAGARYPLPQTADMLTSVDGSLVVNVNRVASDNHILVVNLKTGGTNGERFYSCRGPQGQRTALVVVTAQVNPSGITGTVHVAPGGTWRLTASGAAGTFTRRDGAILKAEPFDFVQVDPQAVGALAGLSNRCLRVASHGSLRSTANVTDFTSGSTGHFPERVLVLKKPPSEGAIVVMYGDQDGLGAVSLCDDNDARNFALIPVE